MILKGFLILLAGITAFIAIPFIIGIIINLIFSFPHKVESIEDLEDFGAIWGLGIIIVISALFILGLSALIGSSL